MRTQFEYDPKPVVEEHYYIQDLINKQERRTAEKRRYRDQKAQENDRRDSIDGFPDIATLDFYCEHCKVDFVARAKKQIDSWDLIAYYKMKHRCGTWSVRHITDRDRDPYFFRSKKIAWQRADKVVDILQPFETGYNMAYGKDQRTN